MTNGNGQKPPLFERIKNLVLGRALDPHDRSLHHNLSLIAFFAWVGLGADGLSSSCYGPEEAFLALQGHSYLALFVALGTVFTIFVISASYSQIIELFPRGGGGYLVASKLLSPTAGMVSGCALLIDYMLTITLSIASGADAIFSFLPPEWLKYRLFFASAALIFLTVLNMRGAKESVLPLVPIFVIFLLTHVFAILYALSTHAMVFGDVAARTVADVRGAHAEIGLLGMLILVMRSYSLGAGTYTGIEAVSNGLPILREPRVHTGKITMRYMAFSLAFMVLGLMMAYLLYGIGPVPGKTLNAVFFETMTAAWSSDWGKIFVFITLFSEACILFVAAQAGFLDGPRVLANMALDRWFPTRFAMLSDRFVSQNGVLIMGGAALILMLATGGSVRLLVVLYAINVFITFMLSQLGMVKHWWQERATEIQWKKKLTVNGVGLVLSTFILISVVVIKFNEGGWITILVTGTLVALSLLINRHYKNTVQTLKRLDALVPVASGDMAFAVGNWDGSKTPNLNAKTAVVLVNGFNGLGLHTLFSIIRLFGNSFTNFVFLQVGVLDAGTFKGAAEVEKLQLQIKGNVEQYVDFMKRNGFYAEGFSAIGNDVVDEVTELSPKVLERFPQAIFFGGQLVFPDDSFLTRFLHNYTVFSMQRRFYHQGIPLVVLPIRV